MRTLGLWGTGIVVFFTSAWHMISAQYLLQLKEVVTDFRRNAEDGGPEKHRVGSHWEDI